MSRVRCKSNDSHSHTGEDRDNIIRHVRWTIVHQKSRFACFEFFRVPWLVQVWDRDIIDVLKENICR
jgi:hypothetical protein